jgi:hypothetical protein
VTEMAEPADSDGAVAVRTAGELVAEVHGRHGHGGEPIVPSGDDWSSVLLLRDRARGRVADSRGELQLAD